MPAHDNGSDESAYPKSFRTLEEANAFLESAIAEEAKKAVPTNRFPRELFVLADAYNQVAELSFQQVGVKNDAIFCAPAVVCRAFAIELLLKFFITLRYPKTSKRQLITEGVLRGHEYSKLWTKLSQAHRDLIADRFEQVSGRPTKPPQLLALLRDSLGDSPFVIWRYAYERDASELDAGLLTTVADAFGLAAQDAAKAAGI